MSTHTPQKQQCSSTVTQTIDAPLALVWSKLRRFDCPREYQHFVKSCTLQAGKGDKGTVRRIDFVSGLPATYSVERLDELDDDRHEMVVSIIGGDHRLNNYRVTTSVTEIYSEEKVKTMVVESYVVDVPDGNSEDDTTTFANTIIGCNLRALAKTTENMVTGTGTGTGTSNGPV